jgi:hypothetical protein
VLRASTFPRACGGANEEQPVLIEERIDQTFAARATDETLGQFQRLELPAYHATAAIIRASGSERA